MIRISCTVFGLSLAACQSGTSLSSTTQEVETTVPEQARQVDMTIYATQHHSNNNCFCTIANQFTHSHAGACTNHYRHGGEWRMNWRAYCERLENADCSESYPVVTSGQQAERATWVGANEHWEGGFGSPIGVPWYDYGSCAKWTWDGGWEGANFCQGETRGMVAASEGSGSPNVFVAAGVGYAMRHGEDQATVAPSVMIGVGQGGVGAGAGAGLDFSFRDQSWGNGYEIKCQYRCRWREASMEVILEEKCWGVGWETSNENPNGGGATHSEAGLTLDNEWHELRRAVCTTEDEEDEETDEADADEADADEADAPAYDAPEPDAAVDAREPDADEPCIHTCDAAEPDADETDAPDLDAPEPDAAEDASDEVDAGCGYWWCEATDAPEAIDAPEDADGPEDAGTGPVDAAIEGV